jgi:glutamyl-tRNA reductase
VSVAIVGVNHRTLPLEALEPLIIAAGEVPKALADLSARSHLQEVVLLSTCMRTEIYAVVSRFHGAMGDIRDFLAAWSGKPPEDFSDYVYSYFDDAAVNHLFHVSAGLDSASLGEPEILGQVRYAAETARREATVGPVLGTAFRHALVVGKRARTETSISRGTTSLSHAAVEMAADALGGLAGRQALVLGTGEVGEVAARALASACGPGTVTVANRTRARAAHLATEIGARAIAWSEVPEAVTVADIVLCATGGDDAVLSTGILTGSLAERRGRPLLLVDLAVPRKIDPVVGRAPGVTLVDMDGISKFVAERMDGRRAEVPAVERIVAEELDRYLTTVAERSVAPLVAALHERSEQVRRAEMDRLAQRLGLDDEAYEAVDSMARRLVAKLLHEPTVNLKAAAGTSKGEVLAEALRELFRIEP